jgi:hypothetical protein
MISRIKDIYVVRWVDLHEKKKLVDVNWLIGFKILAILC